MPTLSDILKPRHVNMELEAANPTDAVEQLSRLLEGDARVSNWSGFHDALMQRTNAGLKPLSCGAAIAHARTDHVETVLMAAGRLSASGIWLPATDEAEASTLRYLFIIGLPPTMAAEYLRVVGALARSLKSSNMLDALGNAQDAPELVEILNRRELQL